MASATLSFTHSNSSLSGQTSDQIHDAITLIAKQRFSIEGKSRVAETERQKAIWLNSNLFSSAPQNCSAADQRAQI